MHIRNFALSMSMLLLVISLAGVACADSASPRRFAGIKDCDACPELSIIPPGTFTMGTDSRHKYERPAHTVVIDKAFAIGVFEVSFDEWQICFDEGACGTEMPNDHKWGMGNRPVINITWHDTKLYLNWLRKKTGRTYRLPSEAEWEYATRAGTQTEFWWGDDIGLEKANCRNCGPEISHQSLPVDSFAPNPWGLYNVHGNVWEWTEDCWNPTYDGAPSTAKPRIDGDCQQRVMRSGSWYYFSKNLRSAWRAKNNAMVKSYGIGFRVVRELP
ncbi:hypothetical protein BEN30_01850 [Magnetovibrio blakemorei]|uniref:Sulfatase-modifying factor enzyme-like domain-containing protein n=2 Tax=Magnetovibrio blakemorei TaxID=28181 RepID=A0A1E5QC28_9PROT|nr:hypothetical protein BEN30_01850 [Magnetovibrio blakemorei]